MMSCVTIFYPIVNEGIPAMTFRVANIIDFGADPTGVADSSGDIQNALDDALANGLAVYAPKGIYRVDSSLTYNTTNANAPGLRLFGDGMYETYFDARVANDYMLKCDGFDSPGGYTFQRGGWFRDFQITNTTATTGARGISLHAAWHHDIERIRIYNLNGSAIKLFGTSR